MQLAQNRYGKSRVRVARLVRHKDRHELHEMTVAIQLEGDFDACYIEGDNSSVVPTDTMKNTVYALAKEDAAAQPEAFALLLGRHFLESQPQVSKATVEIQSHPWHRHGAFSFLGGGSQLRLAHVTLARAGGQDSVQAGVTGCTMLKTTGSAFEGYVKDRYTTLKEASDRILATSLEALWKYRASDASSFDISGLDISWLDISWDTSWHAVMTLLTDTFASHESKSIQHTLYAMGESVLGQCAHVSEIRLTMPNKHYLPVDLTPFGLENANEVFCPSDEPHGLIEAVLRN
jgi:urate oxidase